MADQTKVTASETTAEHAAKVATADAAKATAHDAKVAADRADETPSETAKREAADAAAASTVSGLSRVAEQRAILARAADTYKSAVDTVARRLQGLGGTGDAEVAKAVKALSDDYSLDLKPGGLTQPPAPKGASPFAEKAEKK